MLENLRIVMVETSHPGNIGAAARAMFTMGIRDLRLVRPARFPDEEAWSRATGPARSVLDQARVHTTLADAIADTTLVAGASARSRSLPWPSLAPAELATMVASRDSNTTTAILFGREDRGLTNEELQACHFHVAIPANPDYGVLNVAAAIQVICYEMRLACLADVNDSTPVLRSRRHTLALPAQAWDSPQATAAQVEALLAHLERVISASGFLDKDNPAQVMPRLRRFFLRARPDQMEAGILRGVLSSLERHLPDTSGDQNV